MKKKLRFKIILISAVEIKNAIKCFDILINNISFCVTQPVAINGVAFFEAHTPQLILIESVAIRKTEIDASIELLNKVNLLIKNHFNK